MGAIMLIYDTKTKQTREMTEEEEYIANNLPNPETAVTEEDYAEVGKILLGEE